MTEAQPIPIDQSDIEWAMAPPRNITRAEIDRLIASGKFVEKIGSVAHESGNCKI